MDKESVDRFGLLCHDDDGDQLLIPWYRIVYVKERRHNRCLVVLDDGSYLNVMTSFDSILNELASQEGGSANG